MLTFSHYPQASSSVWELVSAFLGEVRLGAGTITWHLCQCLHFTYRYIFIYITTHGQPAAVAATTGPGPKFFLLASVKPDSAVWKLLFKRFRLDINNFQRQRAGHWFRYRFRLRFRIWSYQSSARWPRSMANKLWPCYHCCGCCKCCSSASLAAFCPNFEAQTPTPTRTSSSPAIGRLKVELKLKCTRRDNCSDCSFFGSQVEGCETPATPQNETLDKKLIIETKNYSRDCLKTEIDHLLRRFVLRKIYFLTNYY